MILLIFLSFCLAQLLHLFYDARRKFEYYLFIDQRQTAQALQLYAILKARSIHCECYF